MPRCKLYSGVPNMAQKHRLNRRLNHNIGSEGKSLGPEVHIWVNSQEVDVNKVDEIVHEETTAEAVSPVLTEWSAVMNISEVWN